MVNVLVEAGYDRGKLKPEISRVEGHAIGGTWPIDGLKVTDEKVKSQAMEIRVSRPFLSLSLNPCHEISWLSHIPYQKEAVV